MTVKTARHWGLRINSITGGNYLFAQEIQLRSARGGPNLLTSSTPVTAPNTDSGVSPAFLVDGNLNNVWAAPFTAGYTIWFDLGTPKAAAEMAWLMFDNNDGFARNPKDFDIVIAADEAGRANPEVVISHVGYGNYQRRIFRTYNLDPDYVPPSGLVTVTVGPDAGDTFSTESAFLEFVANNNMVANNQNVWCQFGKDISGTSLGFSCPTGFWDATHRVTITPKPPQGFAVLARSPFYYPTQGLKWVVGAPYAPAGIGDGVTVRGFALEYTYGQNINTGISVARSGRLEQFRAKGSGTGGNMIYAIDGGTVTDGLVLVSGAVLATGGNVGANYLRNTLVSEGGTAVGTSVSVNYGTGSLVDNVYINFSAGPTSVEAMGTMAGNFSNTAVASGNTTGMTVNTTAGALVVSATDLRPKAGGPLIGSGQASSRSTTDNVGSGRGQVPDGGAWQLTAQTTTSYTADVPQYGVVNAPAIQVKITADNPAPSGGVVYTPSGPSGVTFNPTSVTIAEGAREAYFTMSANSTGIKTIQIANNKGLAAVSYPWNVRIPKPSGTFTSQTLDGQRLTVKIAYGDAPASGSVSIPPAASSPNGAVAQGPFPMTLSGGVGTAVCDLNTAGNYGNSVITLINDGGTLELLSTNGTSLQSVSGSGEGTGGTEQPVGEAPTVTIANAAGGTNGITANGYASLKGDASGTLTASYVPRDGSATVGPEPVTINSGNWTLSKTGLSAKSYDLVLTAFANGQQATATAGPLVVGTVQPAAPTISVASSTANGMQISASGPVNLQGDSSGSVVAFFDPESGGTAKGPFATTISNGTWTLPTTTASPPAGYRVRVRATANGQQAEALGAVVTTVDTPALPAPTVTAPVATASGTSIAAAGRFNTQGASDASLVVFIDHTASGASVGPITPAMADGFWTVATSVPTVGAHKVRPVATANAQTASASSPTVTTTASGGGQQVTTASFDARRIGTPGAYRWFFFNKA